MSDRIFAEKERRSTRTPAPLFPTLRRSSQLDTMRAMDSATRPTTTGGHDFSTLQVQPGRMESCPLPSPRTCPFGGACHSCPMKVQTKLAVGEAGGIFEREADEMAERIMRMTEAGNPGHATGSLSSETRVQRTCAQCEEDEDERLQRKETSGGPTNRKSDAGMAPPIVDAVLRSSGQPLEQATRSFMESRFGRDFSRVRVHTGTTAAESARAVNALAYTVGHDIVFGSSQYAPSTSEGRRILAHELTHVVQQQSAPAPDRLTMGSPDDTYEQESDHATSLIERPARRSGSDVQEGVEAISPRQLSSQRLQRWSYGTGASPHTDYVVVPADDRKRIDAAMNIVSKVVDHPKDFPRCPKFFKDNCPGGTDDTLKNVLSAAVMWKDTDPSPKLLGSSVDPHHIAYTTLSYGIGRWAVAASMFHEMIHNCGVASHDVGDDAKDACGKLPNL